MITIVNLSAGEGLQVVSDDISSGAIGRQYNGFTGPVRPIFENETVTISACGLERTILIYTAFGELSWNKME